MLPAIFAVLFLSPFVASEIYVGQYPQNVDAVVKDPYGNLVPVTGVADTIEVVDLNYGGNMTNNVTGMAIDISVTPVNASGVSSLGYPSYSGGEYPSYPSAGGISYPTAFYQPPSTMASGASGMGKPPTSGFTNGFFPSGGFPSLFGPSMSPSGQPMSPSGPPMSPPTATNTPSAPFAPFPPFSGFGGSASPPTAEPFSPTNQAILSSLGSIPSQQSSSSGDNGSSKPKPSTVSKSPSFFNKPHLFSRHHRSKRSVSSSFPSLNIKSSAFPSTVSGNLAQEFEPMIYPSNYDFGTTSFATQNYVDSYPEWQYSEPLTSFEDPLSQFSSPFFPSENEFPELSNYGEYPNTWSSGFPAYPTASGWPVSGSFVSSSENYLTYSPEENYLPQTFTENYIPHSSTPIPYSPNENYLPPSFSENYVPPSFPVFWSSIGISENTKPVLNNYPTLLGGDVPEFTNPSLHNVPPIPNDSVPEYTLPAPNIATIPNGSVPEYTYPPINNIPSSSNTLPSPNPLDVVETVNNFMPPSSIIVPVFPINGTENTEYGANTTPTGSQHNPTPSNPSTSNNNKPKPFNPFGKPQSGSSGNGNENQNTFNSFNPFKPSSKPTSKPSYNGHTSTSINNNESESPYNPTFPFTSPSYTGFSSTAIPISGSASGLEYTSYPSESAPTFTGSQFSSGASTSANSSPGSESNTKPLKPGKPNSYPSEPGPTFTGSQFSSGASISGNSSPGSESNTKPLKPEKPNKGSTFNPFNLFGPKTDSNDSGFTLNPFNPFKPTKKHKSKPESTSTASESISNPSNAGTTSIGSDTSKPSKSETTSTGSKSTSKPSKSKTSNGLGSVFNPFKSSQPSFNLFDSFNPFKPKKDTGKGGRSSSSTLIPSITNPLNPFSQPNKPNKPFSLFNPFGGSNPFGGGGKKKKPFSSFVALDGALGPIVTSNSTPAVPTSNINSSVESSTQDVEDYEYPDSSNDDDGILSFLQSPLDSLKNLFFPNSTVPTSSEQSDNIPDNDEEVEDPLSLLSNFAPSMTGDTGTTVPLNFTGFTPNGSATGLNSFLSGILNSTFPQWNNISSWNFTTPFFNSSQTPMNFANFLPNSNGMSSSLMNAFNSLMNSNSPSGQNTLKSSMSSLFPPSLFSSSEYDYYEYPEYDEFYPSGDEVEEPEYYSAPGQTVSTLMKSTPSMFSSFQNMFQKPSVMQSSPFSFLPLGNPASPLNSLSSMINSFLNPSSSSSQSPLSAFFPSSSSNQPPLPASSPSSSNMGFLSSLFPTTAGGNNLLTDIESMVDNMLTPFANGTTPLTNMLTNMMKSLNGTSGSSPSMFANILSQSMFAPSDNQMPFNLSMPLSPMSSILSAVNKTGMFGNMSDVLSLFNNLSYLTNQEENNPNFNDTLFWNQTVTDLQTMMKDMTSKLETFANSLNNTKFQKFVKNFNFTMLSSALDDLSAINFTNLAQSSPSPSATFPARPSFPPRKPLPFSFNKPSSPSFSVPSVQPPLVNVGAGSSFLAIPTATDGMLGDAPATDSSQSTPPVPPPAQSSSTTNVNDPGIVDYASPSSPTTTSNPPVSTGNNTTPTSASGVNFGSTWIILMGVLATILGQKKFM